MQYYGYKFQCSSASRKFLNLTLIFLQLLVNTVSVLFSEPKIPHLTHLVVAHRARLFQCSSASRKFLTNVRAASGGGGGLFQCSSASRKFLIDRSRADLPQRADCFSALQRAENSSRALPQASVGLAVTVSVLFSEPKIPHRSRRARTVYGASVSVLFSEPKIPQTDADCLSSTDVAFQCSSASRKFLTVQTASAPRRSGAFQCSSASRKFLTLVPRPAASTYTSRFSALQRAENSSRGSERAVGHLIEAFQCSSASRKFLSGVYTPTRATRAVCVSVLFSEPKIPQQFLEIGFASTAGVSVLFSEPKIPQSLLPPTYASPEGAFQCSSASRKFLT